MKSLIEKIGASLVMTSVLVGINSDLLRAETITLDLNSQLGQISLSGQSGGNLDSKGCGFISQSPNHILNIQERFDYMRVSVQSQGSQATLLIDGPGGRFCALADGNVAEISGFWNAGLYKVYVGDRTGSNHPFTIQLSR